jgi:glycosyltransferase involved in cell wall biosynthesis
LEPGDVPEQVRLLALHLPRDEYELHVCAFRSGPMASVLRAACASLHVLPRRLPLDPWTLAALERHMQSLRPDLVQTWLFEANTHGRLAALQAGAPRLVAVERSLDGWKRWPHWLIDRRLARRTASIVTSHPCVRDFYAARVHAGRLCVIPDGIEPTFPSLEARARLLAELELPPQACLIGACGALQTANRFKDLIWAIDILKWVHADVHLLILGDGPQRGRLMRFVDCVEVCDCVHFLGQRNDAFAIISNLDYFWHAAAHDAASTALLQAMAAGVPCVALDTPAHRTLITHGENGFLAEPDDRPAFARWTHKMLEDASLCRQIAQAGQRRVVQEFTVEKLVQNYRQLYQELLA